MAQAEAKPNIIARTRSFYDQVRGEMRKVTWPTRSELYGATVVVFIVTVVFSLALGIVDGLFGFLLHTLHRMIAG